MSVYLIEGEILQDIADAVREKKGGTEAILAENMASEIRGISGGSTPTEKWLFQNQQFEAGQFYSLDAPSPNDYVTVFLDGVETITKNQFNKGNWFFYNNDGIPMLAYVPEEGGWILNPEVGITSCAVSVRVLEMSRMAQVLHKTIVELLETDLLGVVEIPEEFFYNCDYLLTVTIPHTVETINNFSFGNCSALEKVIVKSEKPPSLAYRAFNACPLKIIEVKKGALQSYKGATNWSEYADIIVEGDV